mgnify:CR=1 FL=1
MELAATEPVEDVAEAVVEQEIETPQDEVVSRGVESIAKDLFGVEPKDVPPETDEAEVEEEQEEESEEKAEEVEVEEEEKEPRPAPQSWKKEMHELWDSLDDGAKDYIELREDQMKKGLEKDRNDAELGRTMRDVFAPYEKMLEAKGISHDVAVSRLMATHYKLATANPEQKKQILDYLAKSYGVTDENVDPNIRQLQNEIHQLRGQLNAGQQRSLQEAKDKIHTQVEAFASEHPYFDDLSEEIAAQIRAGHELDDAYRIAYRASHFYDKDIEKKQKESEKTSKEAKKKEAEKAAKAKSANVRGRDTEKAPTAPKGTMEDTMRDVYRKIQSRN